MSQANIINKATGQSGYQVPGSALQPGWEWGPVAPVSATPPVAAPIVSKNPAITTSSTGARADVNALGTAVTTLQGTTPSPDEAKLRELADRESRAIQAEQEALRARRDAEVAGINSSFDVSKTQTEGAQGKEYAGRSTGLVTSGGGFLGTTQSHEGVLENLAVTHRNELSALEGKRQAAILAARNAYDDKDFALARDQVKLARESEKDIIAARRQFAQDQLSIVQEQRASTAASLAVADKKIEAFAAMDDATFAQQTSEDIAAIDAAYYPGYTSAARKIARDALAIKNEKDAISVDTSILDMRLKIPKGQTFNINGVPYTGLKEADKISQDELKTNVDNDIASVVMDFQKQIRERGWAGVDPTAYDYYRSELAKNYGAAAALKLDKALKDAELSVDYGE